MFRLFFNAAALFVAAFFLFLGGCYSDKSKSSFFSESLKLISHQLKSEKIDYSPFKKIPYASIAVNIDERNLVLILAWENNDERLWKSVDQGLLVTDHGFIVRTFGTGHDLTALRFQTGYNPLEKSLLSIKNRATSKGTISLEHGGYAELPFKATFSRLGVEVIKDPFNENRKCIRFNEQVEVPELNWQFTNAYWVEVSTHRLIQSLQTISPQLPQIKIQELRPYYKDVV